jgi:hypothetical protein
VKANADVEVILANTVDHVLVSSDTGSLKGLGGDLLLLEREKVDASGEGVHRQLLLSDIEDLDLSLRHTTAVARLDVRLVLDVTGALPRTCTRTVPVNHQLSTGYITTTNELVCTSRCTRTTRRCEHKLGLLKRFTPEPPVLRASDAKHRMMIPK